jgi:hypothetical protein
LPVALQVEAQEKPKTPKGRAHKRELYTRRFVNITVAPGGKRKVRDIFFWGGGGFGDGGGPWLMRGR